MNRIFLIIAFFTAALALNSAMAALQTHSVHTIVMQRFDLPQTDYKGGMGMSTFAPNEAHTRHIYSGSSGPEVLYVLEGEVMFMGKGQPVKIVKTGQSLLIPMGVPHVTKAGPQGAKVLAMWVLKRK